MVELLFWFEGGHGGRGGQWCEYLSGDGSGGERRGAKSKD